jgi:hypothetical protein
MEPKVSTQKSDTGPYPKSSELSPQVSHLHIESKYVGLLYQKFCYEIFVILNMKCVLS